MPRVIGIDIPDNKRLEISLTYIYGVGRCLSNEIIEKLKMAGAQGILVVPIEKMIL